MLAVAFDFDTLWLAASREARRALRFHFFFFFIIFWGGGGGGIKKVALITGLLGALLYEHGPKGAAEEGKPDRFTCWFACYMLPGP